MMSSANTPTRIGTLPNTAHRPSREVRAGTVSGSFHANVFPSSEGSGVGPPLRLSTRHSGLILLAVTLLLTSHAAGHGVTHTVASNATAVTVHYDDGTPMAFCDVTVRAPDDHDAVCQEGVSDRNGAFAFLPDTSGVWRVTIDDGMGHMANIDIAVAASHGSNASTTPRLGRIGGLAVGLGAIFAIFGLYALLTARRTARHRDTSRRGDGA